MKRCKRCNRLFFFRPMDASGNCPQCAAWIEEYERRRAESERREREAIEKEKAMLDAIPEYKIVLSSVPYKRQRGYDPIDFSNITPKGKYDSVVVFDTETTGLAPSHDRIVEIAAIKYVNGEAVQKFHSYINPGIPIPERTIDIHGITDDMVKDSPDIGQVLPAFDSFIGDSILAAHNLEFDLKFIFYSGSHFYEKKRKYIDTLEQAKRIYPSREVDSYKLKDLCSYNYIRMVKEHNALADAFAAGRLFWKMVDEKRG